MTENDDKILHYVNDPVINRLTAPENKLVRPMINFVRAGLSIVVFFLISLFIAFVMTMVIPKGFFWAVDSFVRVFVIVCLMFFILCLRSIFIWFIRLYQRYAKSETRLRCCFVPSCSEYAILALEKYGVVVGGVKTIRRLRRCRGSGGVDYP